jgi:hypothetical protein
MRTIFVAATALLLAAGTALPAWAQQAGCTRPPNAQVGAANQNQNPLKGPAMGTGANTAQDKTAATCETLMQPNGQMTPQNGPAPNAAGANGASHSP